MVNSLICILILFQFYLWAPELRNCTLDYIGAERFTCLQYIDGTWQNYVLFFLIVTRFIIE
jgi:hypothetical protein